MANQMEYGTRPRIMWEPRHNEFKDRDGLTVHEMKLAFRVQIPTEVCTLHECF